MLAIAGCCLASFDNQPWVHWLGADGLRVMHCFAMLHCAVVALVTGYFLVCVLSSNMSECGFLTAVLALFLPGGSFFWPSFPGSSGLWKWELLFELRAGPMSALKDRSFHKLGVHSTRLEFSGCFPLAWVGKCTMSKTLKRMVGSFLKTTVWLCLVYRLPGYENIQWLSGCLCRLPWQCSQACYQICWPCRKWWLK